MLRRSIKVAASMMVLASFSAPFSLNAERLMEFTGNDSLLVGLWRGMGHFVDLVVDPNFVWLFWLTVGFAPGAFAYAWLQRFEEQSRGRLGGPSLRYIRWEARLIRLAIAVPVLRRIGFDLEQDLGDLSTIFVDVLKMPALPATDCRDPRLLDQVGEYLRLVLPNLHSERLDYARDSAVKYTTRLASEGVKRDQAA